MLRGPASCIWRSGRLRYLNNSSRFGRIAFIRDIGFFQLYSVIVFVPYKFYYPCKHFVFIYGEIVFDKVGYVYYLPVFHVSVFIYIFCDGLCYFHVVDVDKSGSHRPVHRFNKAKY